MLRARGTGHHMPVPRAPEKESSPYDMQHGSEQRLLGRLLGPATMNSRIAALMGSSEDELGAGNRRAT